MALFTFCILRCDSAECHIFGSWVLRWRYDLQIWTRLRFLYNVPTLQVSSSYVHSLRSYRVDKHTNIPKNLQTNRCHWKHPKLFAMLWNWVINTMQPQVNDECDQLSLRHELLVATLRVFSQNCGSAPQSPILQPRMSQPWNGAMPFMYKVLTNVILIYTVNKKSCSTFVTITLENLDGF